MTVLVDDAMIPWCGRYWCHLTSDTSLEELHAFARLIGLQRSWFQDKLVSRYDVTGSKRDQALAAGALSVSPRELVERGIRCPKKGG